MDAAGESDREFILRWLRQVDPGIQQVESILLNDNNEEWLVTVRYSDGQVGVIEGDGGKVLRRTYSLEELSAKAEADEDYQFEARFERRE